MYLFTAGFIAYFLRSLDNFGRTKKRKALGAAFVAIVKVGFFFDFFANFMDFLSYPNAASSP